LSERGYLVKPAVGSIEGRRRLGQLQKAGVPINNVTADVVFREFESNNDREGVELLHEVGTGGNLLGDTTNYLVRKQLLDKRFATESASASPTEILKSQVSRQIVKRVRRGGSDFDLLRFCEVVIGEGEETVLHRAFDKIAEKYYDGCTMGSPFSGLRGVANDGLVGLDEEEGMEEWLIKFVGINDFDANKIRDQRTSWHISWDDEVSTEENPDDIDDPVVIKKRVEFFCDHGDPWQARKYLERLPADDQIYQCLPVVAQFHRVGLRSEALELMKGIRSGLRNAPLDPDVISNRFASFAYGHAMVVDTEGLASCLQGIDEQGFEALQRDLGATEQQLVDLMLACHLERTDPYFDDLNHVELEYLVNGSYREKPYDGYEEFTGSRMYKSLLAQRIYHFGEDEIRFPRWKREFQRSRQVSRMMAIKTGATGREDFTKWLRRIYTAGDGVGSVRYVYDEIEKAKRDGVITG
jgi:hypothetical protein